MQPKAGSPFGVIVIGRFWDEANLLGLAYDYEHAAVGTASTRVVPTMIPEPSSFTLVLVACGLLVVRRRKH